MKQDKKVLLISLFVSLMLTFLVWFFDSVVGLVPDVYLAPDTGFSHYFWKLTPDDATLISRVTVWGLYLVHQLLSFYFVYRLSKQKVSSRLSKDNWYLLAITFVFTIAHMIQTYVTYDGLAQDVPVLSSQGSVIVMLVLILILGNRTRGLFFGKRISLPMSGQKRVMKYHGFFITWAIIYTFWYHPVVSTPGHLFGFFYMFLLMLQMVFAGTTVHMNRIWGLVLEVTVLFHGTTVAIIQDNGMWPMFLFGFAFIFVVTQVHSLKLKKWMYISIYLIYVLATFVVYNDMFGYKSFSMVHQITWIPIIEYGLLFVFAYILSLPEGFKAIHKKLVRSEA